MFASERQYWLAGGDCIEYTRSRLIEKPVLEKSSRIQICLNAPEKRIFQVHRV